MKARLLLEDGTLFTGKAFGSEGQSIGEVVFSTGMTGYQEVLTSASHCGQIVTLTYPSIGNYGIIRDDFEAMIPSLHGVVVRRHEPTPSNWKARYSIDSLLKEHGIIGISDIDTRMLTRHIRNKGSMRGMITTSDRALPELAEQLGLYEIIKDQVSRVSTKAPYSLPSTKERIVVLDLGVKQSFLSELSARQCDVVVVPHDTSADKIKRLSPDGVVLSHGPGNPKDVPHVQETIQQLLGEVPLFGVCLGHKLFALACGADTTKMKFGHHGNNLPVKDVHTGRCYITTQNHDYTIVPDSIEGTELVVSHVNNNDQTIAGLRHRTAAAFSIQFDPESFPGMSETGSSIDRFIELIDQFKQEQPEAANQAIMFANRAANKSEGSVLQYAKK